MSGFKTHLVSSPFYHFFDKETLLSLITNLKEKGDDRSAIFRRFILRGRQFQK